MPSGVITAIPFSTSALEPRSRNTILLADVVAAPMIRAATSREGDCFSKAANAFTRSAVFSSVRRN